jgi:tRNA 2-thiouridine synthesizing protein A
MSVIFLDLKGLKCPLPALRVEKALDALLKGSVVEVEATDPLAGLDIENSVQKKGGGLMSKSLKEGIWKIIFIV